MDSAKSHRWMRDPGFPFNPSINITVRKSGYVWPGCGSAAEHSSTTREKEGAGVKGEGGSRKRMNEESWWKSPLNKSGTQYLLSIHSNRKREVKDKAKAWQRSGKTPSSVGKSISSGLNYLSSDILWLFLCLLSFGVEWQSNSNYRAKKKIWQLFLQLTNNFILCSSLHFIVK